MINQIKISGLIIAIGAGLILILTSGCASDSPQTSSKQEMNQHYYPYNTQVFQLSNGTHIAYRDTGKGQETLVFIHGLGSYLPVWDKLIPQLASDFRCISLDLPGYGKSDLVEDSISIAFFAQTVETFIQEMGLQQVTLVGHSMGGQIAIRISLSQQIEINQLILFAPAGIETFTTEEAAMLTQLVTPASILALEDNQIAQNLHVNFYNNQMPEDAVFMYEDRLSMKADSNAYSYFSRLFPASMNAMLEGPVFNELSRLDMPVLVFYGENDLLIPNKYLHPELTTQKVGEIAITHIPNSELIMVPQCGHFVPWEQADIVSQAMVSFIEKNKNYSQ